MKLRVARATNNLGKILAFYRDGLGLDLLSQFKDHAGFSGIMLGHASSQYHLEFTNESGVAIPSAPTKENLLVFYFPMAPEWRLAVERMNKHGFLSVKSHNPYWDIHGKTFEDFEGYRVVLVNEDWNPKIPK